MREHLASWHRPLNLPRWAVLVAKALTPLLVSLLIFVVSLNLALEGGRRASEIPPSGRAKSSLTLIAQHPVVELPEPAAARLAAIMSSTDGMARAGRRMQPPVTSYWMRRQCTVTNEWAMRRIIVRCYDDDVTTADRLVQAIIHEAEYVTEANPTFKRKDGTPVFKREQGPTWVKQTFTDTHQAQSLWALGGLTIGLGLCCLVFGRRFVFQWHRRANRVISVDIPALFGAVMMSLAIFHVIFLPGPGLLRGPFYATAAIVANARHFGRSWPALSMVIFLLSAWASLSSSQYPDLSSQEMARWYLAAAFVWGMVLCLRDRLSVAIASVGVWVGCAWSVGTVLHNNWQQFTSESMIEHWYINPNYVAYNLAAGVAIALMWLNEVRAWTLRLLCLAIAGAGLEGILITGSRGTLATAIALFVWALLRLVWRSRWQFYVIVGIFAGLVVSILSGSLDLSSMVSTTKGDTSHGRAYLWAQALEVWREHPMFGSGAGTFIAQNSLGIHAHNAFLDIAAEQGTVGLLALIAALGILLTGRAWRSRRAQTHAGLAIIALSASLLTGASIYGAALWGLIGLFCAMTGIPPRRRRTREILTRRLHKATAA